MSHIIEAIILSPFAFKESTINTIQEDGLSRPGILQFIGAGSLDCELNQQFEVVLTIFYHLVDELLAKGCTKAEICVLARLTAQYWHDSLGRSLPDSLRSLHSELAPLVPHAVTQRSAELYLKYTARSFLQHFLLYRACLAEPRPDVRLRRVVTVEAPDVPAPLREGRRPEEHAYHCQLKALDTEEQLARSVQVSRHLDEAAEVARRQRELEESAASEGDVGEGQYPNSLIGECIELQLGQLRVKMQDLAESSSIDLTYKARRTALPRPASLGPPPRFAATSGVGGGGADKKSTASSRSSAKSRTGGGGDAGKKSAKVK